MLGRQKYVCFVDLAQSKQECFFMVTAWLGTPATMLSVKSRLVAVQNPCVGLRANN